MALQQCNAEVGLRKAEESMPSGGVGGYVANENGMMFARFDGSMNGKLTMSNAAGDMITIKVVNGEKTVTVRSVAEGYAGARTPSRTVRAYGAQASLEAREQIAINDTCTIL